MAEVNEIEMRKAYCNTLIELAKKDKRVAVLEADLMKASGTVPFKAEFPERGIDVGIAEANMVGVASGLCLKGFIPFAATFACFASRRAYDQFFLSSNYAELNVKLTGTDPGVSAAFNGGTHMPFEDIALMREIPGLVIVEPSDAVSTAAFTRAVYEHKGCTYMRLHRKVMPAVYKEGEKFEIGKSKIIRKGTDVVIAALGAVMVQEALKASDLLKKDGISVAVVDVLTVKPLDEKLFLSLAKKSKAFVTCENHQLAGGFGSAVASLFMTNGINVPFAMVGIEDKFGQVGKMDYLVKAYGLDAASIVKKVKKLLS